MKYKIYHKLFKLTIDEKKELISEISSNENLYSPIKTAFGQYNATKSSSSREIISLRSLKESHHKLQYPFQISEFTGNSEWDKRAENFPYTEKFANEICKKLGGTDLGKVMYARIQPGGTINWHTDSFPLYSGYARVHIPLISSPGASSFYTEDGNFVMEEGHVCTYDTKVMHTTVNESSDTRTHLIIDVLVDRDRFFAPAEFCIERIENISTDLANEYFQSKYFEDALSKFVTILFYANIHEDNTATILWNSKRSRDKFFEKFNLQLGPNTQSTLENINWKDSYQFVRDDCLKPGTCHIIRNDFKSNYDTE